MLGVRRLTHTEAAANFLPQTIAGLAATLVAGYLADRLCERVLIIATMTALIAALVGAGFVQPGWTAIGYGMAIGAAASGFRIVEATALPRCDGRGHVGAIRGAVHTLTVGGSALGPLLLALGHDWTGSYRPVTLALTALPLGIIVAAALVKRPTAPSPARPAVPAAGGAAP